MIQLENLKEGLIAGFIDKNVKSIETMRPRLILNQQPNRKILSTIVNEIRSCNSFELFVAFLTKGGLACLIQHLKEVTEHGVKGKIIVSTYLNFTDPDAVETIYKNFKDSIQIRVFNGDLHSKGYIFTHDDYTTVIIGSSNLTSAALCSTRELNIQLISSQNGDILNQIHDEFNTTWENSAIVSDLWLMQYRKIYQTFSATRKEINKEDSFIIKADQTDIKPNLMQQEALLSLKNLREKGQTKALLISATGTGKTYLSAFDAKAFNPKKLLFVVHRELINKSARDSFENVFNHSIETAIYKGGEAKPTANFVFAMVSMLSNHLEDFEPDEFDYIIIDEAHRSAAESYQKILKYFKPKFLLGMTATPERMDQGDIYQNFDHNIAYEVRLSDAMREKLLCDFHYYGVTDLTINGETIEDKTDFNKLISPERAKRIKEVINFYSMNTRIENRKGLIFCSRNDESRELSYQLNLLGMKTRMLSGEASDKEREQAIRDLEDGKINYILTCDIFNEGVDIPFVNQVIMLRATQSAVIFVQQLGRGLRKFENKECLTVIDFIGNYKNNYLVPIALFGDNSYNKDNLRKVISGGSLGIFGNSTIDFDLISKQQIYDSINKASFSTITFLKEHYKKLKTRLQRIPKLMDFEQLDQISPLRFAEACDSYAVFKNKVEKEIDFIHENKLTEKHLVSLKFFSKLLPIGLRLQELCIIKALMQNNQYSFTKIKEETQKLTNCQLTDSSWTSALNILTNGFFSIKDRETFGQIIYLCLANDQLHISQEFSELLDNETYKNELEDLINVGLSEYKNRLNKFRDKVRDNDLVLYQKYTRQDVCKLLNWDVDCASTVYGYKVDKKTNNCPIFVTYKKDTDSITSSINYHDQLILPNHFLWSSRHHRTTESKELQPIINQKTTNLQIPLFVKKDDKEGNEFYYLGNLKMLAAENSKMVGNEGEMIDVVHINYQLEDPIDETIFAYLNAQIPTKASSEEKEKNRA